jgi:N-acetylmuramoyl-L-alanine amidase.
MAGKQTAAGCVQMHINSKYSQSATYYLGCDVKIGQSVHECDRSWCSNSSKNDSSHITIEVSNNTNKEPWSIDDAVYARLIDLCVDICKRNQIAVVTYDGTPNAVLTEHRMFQATACPGTTIHNLLMSGKISQDINSRLKDGSVTPFPIDPSGKWIYEGVDYAPVFDPVFYAEKYKDLGDAGLTTEAQLFQHFILLGMPEEARQAHKDFDPIQYREVETDVAAAIDDDWEGYYKHYILLGKDEIARGERAPFM